jgi:predicted secreted Zn-dependent protease
MTHGSYPVIGSTASALRTVMHTLGPTRGGRTFVACTDWEVPWTFGIDDGLGGFRMTDLAVSVRVEVLVPRWRAARSAPASLVEAWGRYLAAVERHEQGHADLAIEAGRAVLAQLSALGVFTEREALRRAASETAEAAVAAVRERERLYDERSSHGPSATELQDVVNDAHEGGT